MCCITCRLVRSRRRKLSKARGPPKVCAGNAAAGELLRTPSQCVPTAESCRLPLLVLLLLVLLLVLLLLPVKMLLGASAVHKARPHAAAAGNDMARTRAAIEGHRPPRRQQPAAARVRPMLRLAQRLLQLRQILLLHLVHALLLPLLLLLGVQQLRLAVLLVLQAAGCGAARGQARRAKGARAVRLGAGQLCLVLLDLQTGQQQACSRAARGPKLSERRLCFTVAGVCTTEQLPQHRMVPTQLLCSVIDQRSYRHTCMWQSVLFLTG